MYEQFKDKPHFCLTMDTDWASEACMEMTLEALDQFKLAATIFVTGKYHCLEAAAKKNPNLQIGIHPNFLKGSTHGDDFETVIDHCLDFTNDVECYRSHCFYDVTQVSWLMADKGIRYDSNLCLYMQPELVPLQHQSGALRFPVFWEDDVHLHNGGDWTLEKYKESFLSPGLKILNFHPMLLIPNIEDMNYCMDLKKKFSSNWSQLSRQELEGMCFSGRGERHFFDELMQWIQQSGHDVLNLKQVNQAAGGKA